MLLLERMINFLRMKKLLRFVLRRKTAHAVLFDNHLHLLSQICDLGRHRVEIISQLFDKVFQHNDPLGLVFEFVAQICDGLFQGIQSHFFNVLKLKGDKCNFKFEDFRRFRDKLELFGEKGVFYVIEIKIRVEEDLQLVRSVIDNSVDDKFILKLLVKSKGHVKLLVLGITNETV